MDNLSRYTYYLQSIADVFALIISFFISVFLKKIINIGIDVPSFEPYLDILLVIITGYVITNVIVLPKEDVINRNFSDEVQSSLKTVTIPFILLIVYLFATKSGSDFSRIFVVIYVAVSFLLILLFRVALRTWILPLFSNGKSAEKIIILGEKKDVQKVIKTLRDSKDWRIQISGAVLTDMTNLEYLDQVPVIANRQNLSEKLLSTPSDSILIASDFKENNLSSIVKNLIEAGKTVHVYIDEFDLIEDADKYIDEIGNNAVVSYVPFFKMPKRHAFMKRILDVIGSLLLIPLLFFIYILTAIFNNLESRGPVIVNKIRVGKNGRRFYKKQFRILRMDADERIRQGKRPFTIWGLFLKSLHLRGLPELINIISGDMSFCGPHAPSLQRYLEYTPERRKNLCILPGVFGEWAVVNDEEYVISKEREYIKNWSVFKDLLIYLETFLKYITFHSSQKYDEKSLQEEDQLNKDYIEDHKPLEYDHSAYVHNTSFHEHIYLFIKRTIDIVLSLLGIILLSPLLLILCLAVMADDGGAPIYRHERIGYHGKKIYIAKFRSMVSDAGDLQKLLTPEQLEQYKTEFKIDDDPRITKVGSFIRKTSLDELPQLFNILGGSLSIVGPRPIVEKETKIYGKDVAKFLSVKPGLTGYWQAYARNNATYETGERQAMEMYYVDHRSLWLDIKIFFKTFSSVAKEEGAK